MNGITRRIDELGRIVLPKDYRNAMNVGTNCEMNLELKNGTIIITPATNHCCMCGKKITAEKEIKLCDECIIAVRRYSDDKR